MPAAEHCPRYLEVWRNYLAKLRLKPTKNDSVFFDFRVYKGFVNTEIKEHGEQNHNRRFTITELMLRRVISEERVWSKIEVEELYE